MLRERVWISKRRPNDEVACSLGCLVVKVEALVEAEAE